MYLRVQLAQIFALTGAYFMPDCHIVRYLFDTYESCCWKNEMCRIVAQH